VGWEDCTLWQSFGIRVGFPMNRDKLWGFANVCNVDGVSFFLRGGEKKQNKFPRTAPPYQRSTNPINPFFLIISIYLYRINVSSWCFSTLAYNGWRYVFVPISKHCPVKLHESI
jgi:hypothetical protein